MKSSPEIRCCFNFVHTMKLCAIVQSSKLNSSGVIPIGPNVAPHAVFTSKGFLIMFILPEIFLNGFCDIHEHVVPVSNRAIIDLVLRVLTLKFDSFNFSNSKLNIV